MEILILSGKFGMGHYSAALSLREQLEREGHEVRLIDFFDYALPEMAAALYRGFDLLVTYGGGIYNLVHRMTRDARGGAPGQLTRRFGELLTSGTDAVISTHPACSGAAAQYKQRRHSGVPLITCVTDITCHSEWIHRGTDCYLVPTATVRDGLAAKGVDPERVVVTGIPVRESFATGGGEKPGDRRELLIMGGGLGLMPQKDGFYEALDKLPGVHTTILAGKNRKLYERLEGRYENVETVAFTSRVSEYMGRAHLMLSKPGGVTTFEAIAARLPLLAWEPFLEQERENARFLVEHGMAVVVPKEEDECLDAIRRTIYDDEALGTMRAAMDGMGRSLRSQSVGEIIGRFAGQGQTLSA